MTPALSLAILLSEGPAEDVRGSIARATIRAAVRATHRVLPVLFYSDAAYTLLPCPARDRWLQLADATGATLVACPAAAERRGISVETLGPDTGIYPMGLPAWLGQALAADRLLRL
ncbi:MAG: DsrE family protein [Xanthomonadales bacterium]|nr:DsrE family protein [Xanthomonadales bacterium]